MGPRRPSVCLGPKTFPRGADFTQIPNPSGRCPQCEHFSVTSGRGFFLGSTKTEPGIHLSCSWVWRYPLSGPCPQDHSQTYLNASQTLRGPALCTQPSPSKPKHGVLPIPARDAPLLLDTCPLSRRVSCTIQRTKMPPHGPTASPLQTLQRTSGGAGGLLP